MMLRNFRRAAWTLGGLAVLVATATGALPEEEPTETRTLMRGIFASISEVLPLSLQDSKFEDPSNRDQILVDLKRLQASGAALEDHARGRETGFDFLSRSLARDTTAILENFQAGRYSESRFLLHELTQTCAACHSRLPQERVSTLADRFVDTETLSQLSLEERARLLVATRQFEQAAASYEALMASPESDPTSLDLEGQLDDYLELCIRVLRDYERPRKTLERFSQRSDLRKRVRSEVESWIASLAALDVDMDSGPPLDRARHLVGEGESFAMSLEERSALVRYFAASGILHTFVRTSAPNTEQRAESYYLLGVIESRVGRSFWISETETYLEASIRTDPSGPHAERAYALLEEFVVAGYSGSGGTNVPTDVSSWLEELRLLISSTSEAS